MCRLFGFVSHKPVAVTHLLEDIYESFVKISRLHGDGWGLSWYDENDHLQLAKAPESAYASEEFAHKVKHIQTDMLISHVRWATPGFPLRLENTHPFTYHQMAFAHNGAVAPNQKLEQFIAPHLQSEIVGVTDSERYFLALLADYFHIQYQVNNGAVVVASTGLNPGSGWEILRSGQMLVVERDTLRVTVIDVALNSRNSIKEQYKSALQR